MEEYKEPIGALEKAFKILEIICKHKEFTSSLIAEKLNCDKRTARRYIQKIKYLFEDYIETKKGHRYVWKGVSGVDKKIKYPANFHIFLAFLKLGERIGFDKDFWKEVKESFSFKFNESINEIIYTSAINYEKIKDKKIIIEDGINKEKCIKFKYLKYNRFYEIEPLKIILWEGLWYVAGIDTDDNKIKTFAIDLMEDIKVIEDSFFEKTKKIKKFEEKLKEITSLVQISDEKEEEIKVLIFNEVSFFFKRKNYFREQKILKEYKNGSLLISFKVKNKDDFKFQILNWIPYFKIISPEKYEKYFIKLLKEGIKIQNSKQREEMKEELMEKYICLKCLNLKCVSCDENKLKEKSKFLRYETGITPIQKVERNKRLKEFFEKNGEVLLVWCEKERLKRAFYIYPAKSLNDKILKRLVNVLKTDYCDMYDK